MRFGSSGSAYRFHSPTLFTALAAATVLISPGTSQADVNRTPIAIPLIGTQGTASPYPSSITINPVEGQAQTGQISVTLHAVTHPCPSDLAVLLVHGDDKWLMMNNVGGCRPLQGTTIEFVNDTNLPAITPTPNTPFPEFMRVRPSFDGPQPMPPAPFPTGGVLTSGMPTETEDLAGRWDLYVLDQGGSNRGVIAGGWSLNYDTAVRRQRLGLVALPKAPFTEGPAQVYPIAFDMSGVRPDVLVRNVSVVVDFSHQKPDDLVMVLESPAGTPVLVMANAGGNVATNGVRMTFDDAATLRPLNNGPLASGTFLPTEWPEASPTTIDAPGPQPPYRPSFNAFRGEAVRGQWRLWIFDDTNNGTGLLAEAAIVIRTDELPVPTITAPATQTSTSTQPFVRVEGTLPGIGADGAVNWRVVSNGEFYAAGPFTFDSTTGTFFADVPLRGGDNRITYRAWNTPFFSGAAERRVDVAEFTYSLAEGATGTFFDLDVTLGNPGAVNATVNLDLLPQGGTPATHPNVVTANTPLQVRIDNLLPDAAVSTIVRSTNAQPLTVERTMSWDTRGYGGHGGGAASPATRWLFAEGSQGFFNTFILLANDNASAVDVTVKFLLQGGGVVTHPVTVEPRSRFTLFAGDVAQVVNTSFGLDITSTAPIIAERAMYFSMGTDRTFDGGHESAGVNAANTRWFLAEGATGSFFDCFVLLSNPNAASTQVTLTYLLEDGTAIPQTITMAANSRETINVEGVDARLANAAVSTVVGSTLPIVVERAMYWPNIVDGWREAHNSFGVTETALRWAVADGRLSGPRGHDTYILLANPNPVPAEVQVRFLKPGVEITRTYQLNPTSRLNVQASADAPALGEGVFTAEIQVLNFQPIAVEKAMYWNAVDAIWAAGTNVTATRMPPR
jgi:subtilisin-like proprotein convertase family protein